MFTFAARAARFRQEAFGQQGQGQGKKLSVGTVCVKARFKTLLAGCRCVWGRLLWSHAYPPGLLWSHAYPPGVRQMRVYPVVHVVASGFGLLYQVGVRVTVRSLGQLVLFQLADCRWCASVVRGEGSCVVGYGHGRRLVETHSRALRALHNTNRHHKP